MSFFQQVYEFKKLFRDIEKLTIKCVHLKCGIEYNQTCLNNGIFLKYCHIYIHIYVYIYIYIILLKIHNYTFNRIPELFQIQPC